MFPVRMVYLMSELLVAVRRHDIIVSKPGNGLSVTYRKQGRILEVVEPMRIDPSSEELTFWRQGT